MKAVWVRATRIATTGLLVEPDSDIIDLTSDGEEDEKSDLKQKEHELGLDLSDDEDDEGEDEQQANEPAEHDVSDEAELGKLMNEFLKETNLSDEEESDDEVTERSSSKRKEKPEARHEKIKLIAQLQMALMKYKKIVKVSKLILNKAEYNGKICNIEIRLSGTIIVTKPGSAVDNVN